MNVYYMNGAGNDFMVMDARGLSPDFSALALEWCKLSGADGFMAIVTADTLNVRTGPMTSYMLVDTYSKDETVNIHAVFGDWGYTDNGWVFLEYVQAHYATGNCVITRGLNVRMEPNADSEIVGTYTTGDRVTIVEVIDNWGRTDLGWINLKFVRYE